MSVTIPADLERAVAERAERDKISIDDFVRQAIIGQLRIDEQLLDDFRAWEEVSDEALKKVEGSLS